MITAPAVSASSTSDSLMAPTPRWMISTWTSFVPSCSSESATACTEPSTSPLMTRGSVAALPAATKLAEVAQLEARAP